MSETSEADIEQKIDPKRAIPRDEQEKTSKIFVGGVSQDTTDQEFRDYFAQFGRVVDATLMMDKDTGRPRGFGFVTFESEAGVDNCISIPLEIHGKPVEVKRAQPRGNLREEEEAQRRNRFKKDDQGGQGAGAMGQQMGGGQGGSGMSPQVMAQYFQRMQQYFAMMQSQMAMNRGMQMNPQMMQQMQMQQMQQMQQMMGRGGGGQGGPNQMTPQMMQQMQQQMMQQQQQMGGGGGGGSAGGSQNGYESGNAYEGNFDQFQQQPPQGPQGGQRGGGGRRGRGGFGGGRGGYNNNQNMAAAHGDPTSWEGMYDDVPQPGGGDGPSKAPVGAPTGPKRMNQPGANYRGGGRGSHRGYHPYGR